VIGDNSPLLALARPHVHLAELRQHQRLDLRSLHAARLGLAAEVKSTLVNATTTYQRYPSGLAAFNTSQLQEPYIEQAGVLAATVGEALVQDYDGLLRIAPAWPADWTGEGTVAIRHKSGCPCRLTAAHRRRWSSYPDPLARLPCAARGLARA